MSSKIKKCIIVISLILCVGILFISLYSFPKELQTEYQALKFIEGDPKSVETITVIIDGTLYRPVFKKHSFEGNIEIEGYDFTKPNIASMSLLVAKKENEVYWGNILYTKDTSPLEVLGPITILFNKDFDKVSIVTSHAREKNKDDNRNTFIVIGAKNYDEAVKVHHELGESFGF